MDQQQSEDILVDIKDNDLCHLMEMYENTEQPYALCLIATGKLLRQKGQQVQFMSPRNSWKQDGAFIAWYQVGNFGTLSAYTLNGTGDNLYEGLTNTRRIDFTKKILFCGMNELVFPIIEKLVKEKGLNINYEMPRTEQYFYSIPKEDALKFKVSIPEDLELKTFTLEHQDLITSTWPFAKETGNGYVRAMVEHLGGYGLFLQNQAQPIGWISKNHMGFLSMAHTLEAHRRKGYGLLVVKSMSKAVAKEGLPPTCSIVPYNKASLGLFESLGFKNVGSCKYLLSLGINE